ncbi:galactose-1-phosphate uridylyltransferase-like protein, partial [Sarcoptes scabiei]
KIESDQKNPLSPGSVRSNGSVNPHYTSTFSFDNDFPALDDRFGEDDQESTSESDIDDPLFRVRPARGRCKVICFHPDSTKTLALMSDDEIIAVLDAWIEEFNQLKQTYVWVQIFENKGEMMGCSNPHPHCQIWASRFVPNDAAKKDRTQLEYYSKYQKPMLWDYVQREIKQSNSERVVAINEHWVVLVPFWAVWPFETIILSHHRMIQRLDQLNDQEKRSLAMIMHTLLVKYDNLFKTSFPYSMFWHGAPTGPALEKPMFHWILHASYYPPLLRSAKIKKFMVGYELAAQSQRDLSPEKAAEILRECSNQHYLLEGLEQRYRNS